jgi:hypothetical protein
MKRARLAFALVLLMLGTFVSSDALCAGTQMQSAHACCRRVSHTPEVKACCAPRPSQPSAVPQARLMPTAAAHLHDCGPATATVHLSPIAHAHPLAFPPDAAPTPPLVLRT